MSKCVFAGCFDPFTTGHLDVVKRLSEMFDEVCVVVSKNTDKNLILDGQARLSLVKKSIKLTNVSVVLHEGLLVDFCKTCGADCIVKASEILLTSNMKIFKPLLIKNSVISKLYFYRVRKI